MYSFYGGRPGAPFVIVKSFKWATENDIPSERVEEEKAAGNCMQTEFGKGSQYTDVHYDEYVIINTENKNNPTNGNIYRRGYNSENSMGGAEYIGTIVGPSGNSPHLEMKTYDEVINKANQEGASAHSGTGSYAPTTNLIAGKDQNGNFNDTIQWAYCSVRDTDNNDTTVYIGFKIPYTVFDVSAQSISAYSNPEIEKQENTTNHPFYENWKFKIPKGIKGDSFSNLRLNENSELVYTQLNYDQKESGNSQDIILGNYNIINNIDLSEDGLLTVSYTHDDDQIVNPKDGNNNNIPVKWIKNISIDENTKDLIITYNTKTSEPDPENEGQFLNEKTIFNNVLETIKDITVDEYGNIVITYNTTLPQTSYLIDPDSGEVSQEEIITNVEKTQTLTNKIKWINNVSLEDGQLTITYNTLNNNEKHETQEIQVQIVENVFVDDQGELRIIYAGQEENQESSSYASAGIIKQIDTIGLNDDGFITATYNTNDQETLNQTPIKWIDKIEIQNGKDLAITYNTKKSDPENEGQFINQSDIFENVLNVPTNIYMDADKRIKIQWTELDENNNPTIQSLDYINSIEEATLSDLGNLLIRYSNTEYDTNNNTIYDYFYKNKKWKNLGPVSALNLVFNENETSISDKYVLGILKPEEEEETQKLKLIFTLDASKITNKITNVTIQSCSIKIFNKSGGPAIATITRNENEENNNDEIDISAFGFSFKIDIQDSNLISSITELTNVDVLIEQMILDFEFEQENTSGEENTTLKDIQDIIGTETIEESFYGNDKTTQEPSITKALATLLTKIGTNSMSVNSTGGTTITSCLTTLKELISSISTKIGTTTISNNTTGGTTITNSLSALRTAIQNIISGSTTLTKVITSGAISAGTTLTAGTKMYINGDGLLFNRAFNQGSIVIQSKWKDNQTHNLIERTDNGLTSFFGWTGYSSANNTTTYYESETRIRGYHTYIQSHKGVLDTDNLWKYKQSWDVGYYGNGFVLSTGKDLRFNVPIPYVSGTLSASIKDLATYKPTGGIGISKVNIPAKDIEVKVYPGFARIQVNRSAGFGIGASTPCGIQGIINFTAS